MRHTVNDKTIMRHTVSDIRCNLHLCNINKLICNLDVMCWLVGMATLGHVPEVPQVLPDVILRPLHDVLHVETKLCTHLDLHLRQQVSHHTLLQLRPGQCQLESPLIELHTFVSV